jgi:hypothetical protein
METPQELFGQACEHYVKWSVDPKRPRTTFYCADHNAATMITCVPEYVLKAIQAGPCDKVTVELLFTDRKTDAQGKDAVVCVLSVINRAH